MMKLRKTFAYFGTIFSLNKPNFWKIDAKISNKLPRMTNYQKLSLSFKNNYFFSSLSFPQSNQNKLYEQIQELYKIHGWSQQYQQKIIDIFRRYHPTLSSLYIANEEGIKLFELYTETARQNLKQSDPELVAILSTLGLLYFNSLNYRLKGILILEELVKVFEKQPHLKKSMPIAYYNCISGIGKQQLDQGQLQDSLKTLNKFKETFENFDQTQDVTDQCKAQFYWLLSNTNVQLKNYKQCLQNSKKSVHFGQKVTKNQGQLNYLRLLENYAVIQTNFGDRAQGQKAFSKLLQSIDYIKHPEFIPQSIAYLNTCIVCGFFNMAKVV